MYIEKRKSGKNVKYYLVHSYRDDGRVEKIRRRYLGSNLSKKELEIKRRKSEKIISDLIKEINTDVFFFTLTKKQIESLNRYNDKIKVINLSKKEWINFTEDFVYNTNAIEGSSVSEDEVPEILHKKKAETEEEIETKGVAKAVDYIRKTNKDLSLLSNQKLFSQIFFF